MLKALTLAKYIINKCTREHQPITNLQLQKILYYIQIHFLRIKNGSAIFPEDIEAWQFGPVIPEVYYHFSMFGSMPIDETYDNCNIDCAISSEIDPIVEEKRSLNPWLMVEDTHKKDKAWDSVFRDGIGNHTVIPVRLIRDKG